MKDRPRAARPKNIRNGTVRDLLSLFGATRHSTRTATQRNVGVNVGAPISIVKIVLGSREPIRLDAVARRTATRSFIRVNGRLLSEQRNAPFASRESGYPSFQHPTQNPNALIPAVKPAAACPVKHAFEPASNASNSSLAVTGRLSRASFTNTLHLLLASPRSVVAWMKRLRGFQRNMR